MYYATSDEKKTRPRVFNKTDLAQPDRPSEIDPTKPSQSDDVEEEVGVKRSSLCSSRR